MEYVLNGVGVFSLVLHSLEALSIVTEKEGDYGFEGVGGGF